MEKEDDWILIHDGEMFEGTREQFRDCFFDNAENFQIERWCKQLGFSFTLNGKKIVANPIEN